MISAIPNCPGASERRLTLLATLGVSQLALGKVHLHLDLLELATGSGGLLLSDREVAVELLCDDPKLLLHCLGRRTLLGVLDKLGLAAIDAANPVVSGERSHGIARRTES